MTLRETTPTYQTVPTHLAKRDCLLSSWDGVPVELRAGERFSCEGLNHEHVKQLEDIRAVILIRKELR